jgi:hypothetical protein
MAIIIVVLLLLDRPYLPKVNQKNFHVHDQLSLQTTRKSKQMKSFLIE